MTGNDRAELSKVGDLNKCWRHNFHRTPLLSEAATRNRFGKCGLKLVLSLGIKYAERLMYECENHYYYYDMPRMITDIRSGRKTVLPFVPAAR